MIDETQSEDPKGIESETKPELEETCRQVRESFSVQIGLFEPVCCTRPAVLTRKQCIARRNPLPVCPPCEIRCPCVSVVGS